jgi:large subunit ribosomal protein L13
MTGTTLAKRGDVAAQWFVVDGDGQIVGRLATRIATVLMGKHKAIYTPHVECGDFVVVVNADKVRFSGKSLAHPEHPYYTEKMRQKMYEWYTGYPGGRRMETAGHRWSRRPELILREAVRRMLPKNKLGKAMLKKLKLYSGPEHPHQAQQPAELPEHLRV